MAAVKKRKVSEATLAKRMAKAVKREIDKRIAEAPSQVENRYEAAIIPYQTRSWLYEGVQDAQYDIDPYTRTELLRVSRYFEKNSWVCKRLCSVFNQYTFGPHGLQMVPASQDNEDYNQAAGQWWQKWSRFPDLTSQQPLSVLEHVMGRRWFFDGEIWAYKTKSPDTGRPRIQLIEAHRIQNPSTDQAENGNEIRDGIELEEETKRPVAVYVAQKQAGSYQGGFYGTYTNSGLFGANSSPLTTQTTDFVRVPIERMIHLYEPERAGQHRGIGALYPVLRTVQDLHELTFLEKLRAKDAARTSAWITNSTGQANARGLRALALQGTTTNQSGQTGVKALSQYFDTVEGAERQYLKTGEDVKFLSNPNPSASAQWFYDYLVRQICAGTGISALLVMPWSLQGTVTRADLDIMSGYFRCKSSVAIAAIRELYVWVMGWAVKFDRSLDGYPDDWYEVTATPPRSPNVDVGRNSAAIIAEYQTGLRTLSDICGELGHDWRRVIKQRSVEYQFAQSLAEELGIEPEKLLAMSAQSATKPPTEEDSPLPEKGSSQAAQTALVL